jgi:hypothetical protein
VATLGEIFVYRVGEDIADAANSIERDFIDDASDTNFSWRFGVKTRLAEMLMQTLML